MPLILTRHSPLMAVQAQLSPRAARVCPQEQDVASTGIVGARTSEAA